VNRRQVALLAEFDSAEQLLAAVRQVRTRAHASMIEAYSPFPIEGLTELLGARPSRIPLGMLLGAIAGGAGTYALEWYAAVIDYPLNVGGRPLASWPAFLPPAIEMTILGAAVVGTLTMLLGNRLPRLYHPLFAVPAFERASGDRFFLLLHPAADDPGDSRVLLQSLAPVSLTEVPE
jgi:Protein of unknown function (DUF3341)